MRTKDNLKAAVATSDSKDGDKKLFKRKKLRDPNAPKAPGNAYALFIHDRFTGGERPKGSHREAALHLARAWKALSEQEKQPYIQRAIVERATYAKEWEKYKRSDQYKQFLAKKAEFEAAHDDDDDDKPTSSQAFKGTDKGEEVPIFSKEFLALNKVIEKEAALRLLRREIGDMGLEISLLVENIGRLEQKAQLLQYYVQIPSSSSSPSKKLLEKWRKEIISALKSEGLLSAHGLKAEFTAEELITKLEQAANRGGETIAKLRQCLSVVKLM